MFIDTCMILRLALHRIADVAVVRHHHHQASVAVGDAAEVHRRAVAATFGGAAAARAPEVDARHLRDVRDLEERRSEFEVVGGREHLSRFREVKSAD